MEQFQIHTHKVSSPVDFITGPYNLTIKAIPPGLQPEEYRADQAIITAHFYGRLPDGSPNLDIDLNYDFEILPHDSSVNRNMQLFDKAIEYYCKNALKKEPDSLSHDSPAFYQFEEDILGGEVVDMDDDDKLPF